MADESAPAALGAALAAREEKLDVLVNNAGAGNRGKIEELTAADWDVVMDVNVKSLFFLTQQVLPLLRKAASAQSPARSDAFADADVDSSSATA